MDERESSYFKHVIGQTNQKVVMHSSESEKKESSWVILLGPLPYQCVWVEINGVSLNLGIFTCYFHPLETTVNEIM